MPARRLELPGEVDGLAGTASPAPSSWPQAAKDDAAAMLVSIAAATMRIVSDSWGGSAACVESTRSPPGGRPAAAYGCVSVVGPRYWDS